MLSRLRVFATPAVSLLLAARIVAAPAEMLSPIVAGAAMSLSSVSVIANALRLRFVKLDAEHGV